MLVRFDAAVADPRLALPEDRLPASLANERALALAAFSQANERLRAVMVALLLIGRVALRATAPEVVARHCPAAEAREFFRLKRPHARRRLRHGVELPWRLAVKRHRARGRGLWRSGAAVNNRPLIR